MDQPERLSCMRFIQELKKTPDWKLHVYDGEYVLRTFLDGEETRYLSPNAADFTELEWASFEAEISYAIKIKMGVIDGSANGDEARPGESRTGDAKVE